MKSGIYQIVNTATGRTYVGSALDFQRRWNEHRYRLRKGNHHSIYMQRSWQKHGEEAFEFRKLLICEPRNLLMYEQIVIDRLKPEYNISPTAGNTLGRPILEATRKKLSLAILGIKRSEETKQRMSDAGKARIQKPVSTETRLKQSLARKGMKMPPRSPDHMKKIAAANRKFNEVQIKEMKRLLLVGSSQSEIARVFSCSPALVCHIASGKAYSEIKA